MIVPKPIVGKIVRGDVRMVYRLASTRRPRIGERLYVKARQKDDVACHVIVTEVDERPLMMLSFEDARACGYKTRDDFKAAWIAAHDAHWVKRRGEQIEDVPGAYALSDEEIVARFDWRWAPRSALVISFELDHAERPRLLAHRNARANYVEHPAQAMPHEPEAVPASTQQQFSREGHQGWAARELQREADRERLGLEERLRLARIEARAAGVDVSQQEDSILRRIKSLESKVRKRA